MKLWAFLSLLVLGECKPNLLPGTPSQLYNTPNVAPPPAPAPSIPPTNTYVPPGPQPSIPGDFVAPTPQEPQPFPSPTGGQDESLIFPELPQPEDGIEHGPAPGPVTCPDGQVDRGDGTCATPQITRNLFLYRVPDDEVAQGAAAVLPDPKVHYNFVFIRTADQGAGLQPIVAPAPQQKTLVYVLNKKQDAQAQQVIQQESKPTQPEVYFVSYKDGDNLDLPGGVDLQTALSQSLLQGEIVENTGETFIATDDITTTGPKGYNYNSPQ